MGLAMKTGHELVTKNLSGAINGTQLNLVNASGATEVFGFPWAGAPALNEAAAHEVARRHLP